MTRIGKYLFLLLLILLPHNTVAQTCCLRTIAILPIGDTILANTFESPLHRDCAKSDCHPYSIMSLRGLKALERLTEEIGRVSGAPPDPHYTIYIWEGALVPCEYESCSNRQTADRPTKQGR